jgi:hypothetical protein
MAKAGVAGHLFPELSGFSFLGFGGKVAEQGIKPGSFERKKHVHFYCQ